MNLKLRVATAIFISLILTIMPLGFLPNGCKPGYLLLVVLYIQFYLPQYFSLVLIYFLSFLLDVLLATVIGEHALALFLTTWLVANRTRRFVFFPISQQLLTIFLLCSIYQFSLFIVDAFLGNDFKFLNLTINIVCTTLLWPLLKMLADSFFHTIIFSRK